MNYFENVISEYERFFKKNHFAPDMVILNQFVYIQICLYFKERGSYPLHPFDKTDVIYGMRVVVCENFVDNEVLCVYAGGEK